MLFLFSLQKLECVGVHLCEYSVQKALYVCMVKAFCHHFDCNVGQMLKVIDTVRTPSLCISLSLSLILYHVFVNKRATKLHWPSLCKVVYCISQSVLYVHTLTVCRCPSRLVSSSQLVEMGETFPFRISIFVFLFLLFLVQA